MVPRHVGGDEFLVARQGVRESDAALDRFVSGYADVGPGVIAEVYAYRGDRDRAFEWLERAYRQRDNELGHMKHNRLLANLRDDARWNVFLRKVGMADDQLKSVPF
jgi:hypothetical protein